MTDLRSIYPCGRIARRRFLFQAGGRFLGSALGALWARGRQDERRRACPATPKAKSVIFLFMCGGVSHIDTFDPKDNKYAGKLIDAIGFGDNIAQMKRPVIPCLRTFTHYGKSGIPVSDWFPNVGGVIDEFAVVRSMWCHETNHFPGGDRDATGKPRPPVRPSLPWELGLLRARHRQQESADVREHRPAVLAGAIDGRLSGRELLRHAVPARRRRRFPNLNPPKASHGRASATGRCRRSLELNKQFREDYAIESGHRGARASAYELAARMQLKAPAIVDFSSEPEHVKRLYGIGEKETDDFGRQLLLARRLAENGVRFIQICHAGGGNGAWDAHGDMKTPRAALPRRRQADRRADPRSEAARHARQHAGGLHQRVRPHPVVAEHDRPRPQRDGLHVLARRRRRQGRHDPRRDRRRRLQGGRKTALHQRPARHDPAPAGPELQEDGFHRERPAFHLVEEGDGPISNILC